ncbi:MAG: DNA repair protein RecO [Dehalococcoidia bacterium]
MAERPRSYRTDALILARRTLGEADSVFTILSPEFGRCDVVARGVRKATSKLRGHLEALACVHLQLARGRSMDVITQVMSVEPFRALREDLAKGALAQYVAELVARATEEHQAQPEVYRLAMLTLSALAAGAGDQACRYFEIHVLAETGYAPQLDHCARCGGRLEADDSYLSPAMGGLACAGCGWLDPGGRPLSGRAIRVLRYARQEELSQFMAVRIEEPLARELEAALGLLVRQALEVDLRTARFVADVRRLPVPDRVLPEAVYTSENATSG